MKEIHDSKTDEFEYVDEMGDEEIDRLALYLSEEEENEYDEVINVKSWRKQRQRDNYKVELLNESWGRKPSRWREDNEDW